MLFSLRWQWSKTLTNVLKQSPKNVKVLGAFCFYGKTVIFETHQNPHYSHMELLYIWIEKYKNIERQGFNFSPKYRFEFTENNELFVHKNNYPNDFFNSNVIDNVTAIIGENGSGKSTLLNFLTVIKKKILNNDFNFILAVEINKEKFILWNHHEKIQVYNSESFNIENKAYIRNRINEDLGLVFYSNCTIDETLAANFDSFIIDISNQNLFKTITHTDAVNYSFELIEKPQAYRRFNLRTQLRFFYDVTTLKEFKLLNLPIKLPTYIRVGITSAIRQSIFRDVDKKEVPQSIKDRYENIREVNNINDFINLFYEALCLAIYSEMALILERDNDSLVNILSQETSDKDKIKQLFDYYELLSLSLKIEMGRRGVDLSRLSSIYDKIEKLPMIGSLQLSGDNILIPIDTIEKDPLLLDIFIEYYGVQTAIFSYEWYFISSTSTGSLSNGELSLINTFARFYHALSNTPYNYKLGDNIAYKQLYELEHLLLLIDEGDLGLHPQWQKEYLNILLSFFSIIFDNFRAYPKKSIQIILTSHSPFLVSDLPKENIIFLEKDKKTGLCKVSDLKNHSQTFGQNIHTLLADSFFMEGGLIGEFAKSKIQNTLTWLNNQEDKTNATHHKQLIEMIGEPIVRQKLLDMYFLKMGIDGELEQLKAQKQTLEAKIQALETQKAKQ